MCSSKVFLFLTLLTVGYCDKEGHGHGGHHLYFHEFYYLIFLALKFKIILVIGSIWTFGLVLAKVFAVFKFAEYMKKQHHSDHHEIIYTNPHGSWDYGKSYSDYGGPPADVHFDHDHDHHGSAVGGDYSAASYDTSYAPVIDVDTYDQSAAGADYSGHGRSQQGENNWFYSYFHKFTKMIQRLHITDLVFKEMKVQSEDCKRKFVCEAEYYAKHSRILRSAFDLLSDNSYQKYKSNKNVSTVDECARLNPKCIENT